MGVEPGRSPRDPADALQAAAAALGPAARTGVPLGPRTTYRVGGAAALFVQAEETAALRRVHEARVVSGLPVLVVGNGSNLLVSDRGFGGIAVALGDAFAEVVIDGTEVRAGGAASLPVVARRSAATGLTGFEWAVGVPGSIGGAVRMNAGGHGSDMAASLVGIRRYDLRSGEDGAVDASALRLGYRTSSLTADEVVTEAHLSLARDSTDACEARVAEVVRWRRAHQPGGANAGSVFTNPPGDSAGRLVDVSGCRGMRVGTACVSTKHANFIQADEGGAADDVAALMWEVRARVAEVTGVVLEPETHLVGFPGTPGGSGH